MKSLLVTLVFGLIFSGNVFLTEVVHAQWGEQRGELGDIGDGGWNGDAGNGWIGDSSSPDNPSSPGGIKLFDPVDKSIEEIFLAILDILIVFAIPIILFFIVWAGFLYVTAAGNSDKVKQATTALTYAVIGGLLVLGARVLLEVITNTINAVI